MDSKVNTSASIYQKNFSCGVNVEVNDGSAQHPVAVDRLDDGAHNLAHLGHRCAGLDFQHQPADIH